MNDILIQPLTQDAFAPYGDILTLKSTPDKLINQGLCGRHHDLAAMDFGPDGRAGVSLFDHGVLTPLFAPGLFAVVDRIGNSANLQEYWYETPFTVSGDVT